MSAVRICHRLPFHLKPRLHWPDSPANACGIPFQAPLATFPGFQRPPKGRFRPASAKSPAYASACVASRQARAWPQREPWPMTLLADFSRKPCSSRNWLPRLAYRSKTSTGSRCCARPSPVQQSRVGGSLGSRSEHHRLAVMGALDTGTIANNTWYHVWVIQHVDTGIVDVLISANATASYDADKL